MIVEPSRLGALRLAPLPDRRVRLDGGARPGATDREYTIPFEHDAAIPAGYVRESGKRIYVEPTGGLT